jgi:hypothetical protein
MKVRPSSFLLIKKTLKQMFKGLLLLTCELLLFDESISFC